MVGEGGAQTGALFLSDGCQVWIVHEFVFEAEVVEALGMADDVNCWSHDSWVLFDVASCLLTVSYLGGLASGKDSMLSIQKQDGNRKKVNAKED